MVDIKSLENNPQMLASTMYDILIWFDLLFLWILCK